MAKYQITNKIEKEWNGKKFIQATLVDEETGDEYPNIGAWAGEFSGEFFEGELEKSDKGYWKIKKQAKGNPNFKTQQIEKIVERKENSISKFQDNKEFSIMVASTMSGAVALAVAEQEGDINMKDTPAPLSSSILKWRKFLLDNWNVNPKDLDPLK